jgi:protein O-mannosyl-transferase
MREHEQQIEEFSIKRFFIPLTTSKAIHWIIIVGLIVYANMLFNSFLWDDITYITNNPQIHALTLQTFINTFKVNLFNSGGEYRPLTAIYSFLMYSVFGNAQFFYHIFQLCLHITNAVLVFIFLRFFFSKKISLFLSLIFLIHPMQTEAVSFIASIGNPLFFLFGISALILSTKDKVGIGKITVIYLLLFLSSLAKETGILFIFLILFYRLVFHKKQIGAFLLGSSVSLSLYLLFRVVIGGVYLTKIVLTSIARLSLAGRLINIPEIFYYYIKTFFLPVTLSVDQQWVIRKINFSMFYFPLIIDLIFLTGIVILGWYIFKRQKSQFPVYLFFFFWFLIGIGLNLQIFPLDFTVSDRWIYFPMVGLLGLMALFISIVCKHFRKIQTYGYILALVILLFLSVRTIIRNTNWQNQLTLFSHDITIQDNFDSENNLGSAYTQIGNPKLALIHYKKSVSLLPNDTNLYNLGYTYEQLGDTKDARKYYQKVLADKSSRSTIKLFAFQALGFMFINNEPKTAKQYALSGLQEYHTDGSLYSVLAIRDYQLHDRSDALSAAHKAEIYLPNGETNVLYLLILNNKPLNYK